MEGVGARGVCVAGSAYRNLTSGPVRAVWLWQDVGYGAGRNHSINFPLRDGIDDETFQSIFRPVRRRLALCFPAVRHCVGVTLLAHGGGNGGGAASAVAAV